ncbi:glycosyltransferase family 4 protein [soil metagenome]
MKRLRLLTIGHSYVVTMNRRLVRELALQGADRWDVTVAAPEFVHGDLSPIHLTPEADANYSLRSIPMRLTRNIHIAPYSWRRLKRILHEPWDMVYAWEEPYIFSGWQIAHLMPRGTPLTYLSFQNLPKQYPTPFRQMERAAMRRASGWIAAGYTTHETLRNIPIYQDRPSTVIPLGVDIRVFRPDADRRQAVLKEMGWSSEGPPVIGLLGRLIPEKGLNLLMNVLDQLQTPWRALFVGGGVMEPDLRQWAQRYPDRVRIMTGVGHDEVPRYLNAMDILAAPSQTMPRWREQLGRMLIEAFASGVAVVGSDSGEIPRVIADAGRVCPENDVAAWTKTLEELILQPELRQSLIRAGRERAVTVYGWDVVARQFLNFFETLLSPSPTL